MRFIPTDKDVAFSDEWGESRLSEEGAWWDTNGDVYVWTPEYDTEEKQLGAFVHEAFEYIILFKKKIHNKVICNFIHYVANILEIFVSLGKSPVLRNKDYWKWQNFRGRNIKL
jgi:hypothetical protein